MNNFKNKGLRETTKKMVQKCSKMNKYNLITVAVNVLSALIGIRNFMK